MRYFPFSICSIFTLFLFSAFTFTFAQSPVNISEGFENTWPPAGWFQSSFSRISTLNHTAGGTFSAEHNMFLNGSGNLKTIKYDVLNGEEFDTISFWVYRNAFSLSGNISVDIIGAVTNSNLATINLTSLTGNSWTKFSYIYNVTQNDSIALNLSITNGTSVGTITFDDIRIIKSISLPVEMVYFNGSVGKNNVTLSWSTVWEMNNKGFDVERAVLNGSNILWNRISFIPGSGTTNQQRYYSFWDYNLNSGNYLYRLRQTDYNGNFEYFNLQTTVSIGIPDLFTLEQSYPNPSNPSSLISYQIPVSGLVSLKVYDLTGMEVKIIVNEFQDAGYHSVRFEGKDLSSGIYFYRINSGNFNKTMKMILIK